MEGLTSVAMTCLLRGSHVAPGAQDSPQANLAPAQALLFTMTHSLLCQRNHSIFLPVSVMMREVPLRIHMQAGWFFFSQQVIQSSLQ